MNNAKRQDLDKLWRKCCRYLIDIVRVMQEIFLGLIYYALRIPHYALQLGGAEVGKKGELMGSISETRL